MAMGYLAILCIILTSTVCFTVAGKRNKCGPIVREHNCECKAKTAGMLKRDGGKVLMCDGNEWKGMQQEISPGSKSNPGYSCKDILDNGGEMDDGVYWITLTNRKEAFQVYCDMAGGGWTLAFKAVSGANTNAFAAYNSGDTYAEDAPGVTKKDPPQDYKNRIVLRWGEFNPSEARVVLYKEGNAVKELTFDAKGSDKLNWFQKDKLKDTPWADMKTEGQNFFSIQGSMDRNFFISRNYGGCEVDAGWMVITAPHCQWENRYKQRGYPNGNVVLYSNKDGYVTWSVDADVNVADVLAVYVR